MRVGINGSILGGRVTGVGNYLLNIINAFANLPLVTEVEFIVFGVPLKGVLLPSSSRLQTVAVPDLRGPRRLLWEQVHLPALCKKFAVDVLHCPDFARPIVSPVPVVNTIHDLSYFASEHYFPLGKRIYKRSLARIAISRSRAIIVDSEFTKIEILRLFKIDSGKITVALLGGPNIGANHNQRRTQRNPYLLFVGTLEGRKNVAVLVDAYAKLRRKGISHSLVLVGQPGFGWNEISAAIQRNPFKRDIEVRGYVGSEQLTALYEGADLFVFPSKHEGFGLPILEAMASGCPVLCSRAGSLPEVGGDAVEYVDVHMADNLADSIIRVLSSELRREELIALGRRRLTQFSWQKCAESHVLAFGEAFAGRSRNGSKFLNH